MQDLDNLDWSAYVLVMEDTQYDVSERNVFIHLEQDEEDQPLCEECELDEPRVPGMRYWLSKEIAIKHDWPHTDQCYCGKHMREMLEGGYTENVVVTHYHVPPGLVVPKSSI